MMWHKSQPPSPGECCQTQYSLYPCETFTDATPRSTTEREIGKLWTCFAQLGCPPLWIERQRIIVIPLIAAHDILTYKHERLLRNEIAGECRINSCQSTDSPCWWIESHRFGQHHFGVTQLRYVGEFGFPRTQYLIEFLMKACLDLGMFGKEKPGPGQSICSRFMSRKKDCHQLVAELLISHLPTVSLFVLSEQQHRQKISVIGTASSSLINKAEDDSIEFRSGSVETPQLWQRQLGKQLKERQGERVKQFHYDSHRFADFARFRFHVRIKQSLTDDA